MFRSIGLISSVPEEGHLIHSHIRRVRGRKKETAGLSLIVSGNYFGKDLVYIVSGMGKVNAAHAATVLLERFSPHLVILFGVGGAYPSSGLKVGDIAAAEMEIYGDEGVLTPEGFRETDFIGIPLLEKGGRRYFNEFPLLSPRLPLGCRRDPEVRFGTFVTVSTCTGTRDRAEELEKRLGAICENMEGAAVAQICAMYGTMLIEIRGISNMVEDRDKRKWDLDLASERSQELVMELLKDL
jgi:futalosine hydrolase